VGKDSIRQAVDKGKRELGVGNLELGKTYAVTVQTADG
jgi:hypothetical protein